MARKMRPGQKNNLDALCRHYEVNNSQRELHGALLDAELLAEVYLHMTGGQTQIDLGDAQSASAKAGKKRVHKLAENRTALRIVQASAEELKAHEEILQKMGEACRWPL